MMLQPIRDQILVFPDPTHELASPILSVKIRDGMTDSKQQLGKTGTIIAVGEGKVIRGRLQPLEVKVGDRIMFGEYDYPKFDKYLVLCEADVAGVMDDDDL